MQKEIFLDKFLASIDLIVPEDLKQAFIDEFADVGLNAGVVQCFSAKPSSIKEYLSVIYERGKTYVPLVLKVLDMFQRKNSIRIEIAAGRSLIDLKGVSTDDALKLIAAASSIRVSHCEDSDAPNENTSLNQQR